MNVFRGTTKTGNTDKVDEQLRGTKPMCDDSVLYQGAGEWIKMSHEALWAPQGPPVCSGGDAPQLCKAVPTSEHICFAVFGLMPLRNIVNTRNLYLISCTTQSPVI